MIFTGTDLFKEGLRKYERKSENTIITAYEPNPQEWETLENKKEGVRHA